MRDVVVIMYWELALDILKYPPPEAVKLGELTIVAFEFPRASTKVVPDPE